jgi:hypothetical protein
MTDEALVCFVQWCRWNDRDLVENPEVARRVFNAYAAIPPYDAPPNDGSTARKLSATVVARRRLEPPVIFDDGSEA